MTSGPAEMHDARRRSRACIVAILDTTLDQATRDRLCAELMVEHQFNGLLALAAVALTLLRALSPTEPLAELQGLSARHPDPQTVERTDEILAAYVEDLSAQSTRLYEAIRNAGWKGGGDATRDLVLVAARAARELGIRQGISGLEVMAELAELDETRPSS